MNVTFSRVSSTVRRVVFFSRERRRFSISYYLTSEDRSDFLRNFPPRWNRYYFILSLNLLFFSPFSFFSLFLFCFIVSDEISLFLFSYPVRRFFCFSKRLRESVIHFFLPCRRFWYLWWVLFVVRWSPNTENGKTNRRISNSWAKCKLSPINNIIFEHEREISSFRGEGRLYAVSWF